MYDIFKYGLLPSSAWKRITLAEDLKMSYIPF